MKLSRIASIWSLLLLAAALSIFLFFFERYSEEIDLGFGPEARRNPFLAAEQFLDRIETPHRRADNIAVVSTLGDNDALFLASSSQLYNSDRMWELLDWVETGGQAIVIAHVGKGDNERDLLLEMLGLEVSAGNLDLYFNRQVREVFGDDATDIEGKSLSEIMHEHNRRLDKEEAAGDSADHDRAEDSAQEGSAEKLLEPRNPDIEPERLINLTSPSGIGYSLYFDPAWVFVREDTAQDDGTPIDSDSLTWVTFQKDSEQSPLVQYDYGKGRITLMTDGGLWRNHRIGEFDHAYFLSHLIGERALVLITRPHFDGLGTLIRRYAPELSVAGLLALLAWIINRSRRFGPLTPEPARERRSLLEHIRASGRFYWQQDRAQTLFEKMRDPVLRRITGLTPSAARQLPAEKHRDIAQSVATQTGLAVNDIFATLWGDAPRSEDDFTARIRSIQIIEAAL